MVNRDVDHDQRRDVARRTSQPMALLEIDSSAGASARFAGASAFSAVTRRADLSRAAGDDLSPGFSGRQERSVARHPVDDRPMCVRTRTGSSTRRGSLFDWSMTT
jgi:hypothetical protein